MADVDDERSYVPAMEDAGFVLRVREAGHRMFRTPERDVHIHVYSSGDQAITDYLDLRDWLRVDASDRALYEDVKRDLATETVVGHEPLRRRPSRVIQQVLGRRGVSAKARHPRSAADVGIPRLGRDAAAGLHRSVDPVRHRDAAASPRRAVTVAATTEACEDRVPRQAPPALTIASVRNRRPAR